MPWLEPNWCIETMLHQSSLSLRVQRDGAVECRWLSIPDTHIACTCDDDVDKPGWVPGSMM